MKYNFLTAAFLLLIAASCNKSSLVEGYIPETKSFILDTPVVIKNNYSNISTSSFVLKQLSLNAIITLRFTSSLAVGTAVQAPVLLNDSVVTILCQDMNVSQNNYRSAIAYTKGQQTDTAIFSTAVTYLAVFFKHKPYASNIYNSTNTYYSNAYKPAFVRNQDAYLAFRYIDPASGKLYYGWILLQCSEASIIMKAYGYKTYEPAVIGY